MTMNTLNVFIQIRKPIIGNNVLFNKKKNSNSYHTRWANRMPPITQKFLI